MHHVTAERQGLSWELKVAVQERQKLFLQELEEPLIAPQQLLCQQLVDALDIRETELAVPFLLCPVLAETIFFTLAVQFLLCQVQIHQYLYQVHNMWFQAQVSLRKIHQYPYQIQIEKTCDTVLQFQAQERELHQ